MTFALRAATLLLAFASFGAMAQATTTCPALPADTGLRWEKLEGPGFVFCRALRSSDGSEAFALTLSQDSPFKPNRGDRAEESVIAGTQARWYRSEIAGDRDALAREALVELDSGQVAHFSLRASDEAQLHTLMQQVGEIDFASDQRLSSN